MNASNPAVKHENVAAFAVAAALVSHERVIHWQTGPQKMLSSPRIAMGNVHIAVLAPVGVHDGRAPRVAPQAIIRQRVLTRREWNKVFPVQYLLRLANTPIRQR